jgi:hypothetical protein
MEGEGSEKRSLVHYMKIKQALVIELYLHFLSAKLVGFRFKVKSQTLPVAVFLVKQGRESAECRLCGADTGGPLHSNVPGIRGGERGVFL